MKIIIVQLNRIGDLVLLTPAFSAFKERHPGSELHVLAGRKNWQVLHYHPMVDRVLVYRKNPMHLAALYHQIRRNKYKVWVDPRSHPSTEGSILARLSSAPIKIGYNKPGKNIFNHRVDEESALQGVHYAERGIRALKHIGVTSSNLTPSLTVNGKSEMRVKSFISDNGIEDYCLVNISANGPDRYWQKEKWIHAIRALEDRKLSIVLSCLPKDLKTANEILKETRNSFLCGPCRILDVMSLVNNAKMVLTVDTSIVHIASAFNKPIAALYVNLVDFYSQYLPLSDKRRVIMAPKEGAQISDIDEDLAIAEFQSLVQEVNQNA